MTRSAPRERGLHRKGVAVVLSTIRGMPAAWAARAAVRISRTCRAGLAITSLNTHLVRPVTAA